MNTPRTLLLDRHRPTDARLDAIRIEVVRALGEQPDKTMPHEVIETGFLATCWQELFVSCRRSWMGLGVAWAVVLLFAAAGGFRHGGGPTVAEATPPMLQAMEAQRRLRDELLGMVVIQKAQVARPNHGPRSEFIREERYV